MGFYLWLDRDVAWAQGCYEYRPMGAAVVAASDLFTHRDFDSARKVRLPPAARYLGQFASLGQVNGVLQGLRRGAARSGVRYQSGNHNLTRSQPAR
jgi:hypothetical protein